MCHHHTFRVLTVLLKSPLNESSPIHFPAEIVVRRLLFEAFLLLWVAYELGNSENYGAYGFKERAYVFNPHDWPLFTDTNALSDLVPSRRQIVLICGARDVES